MFDTPVALLVFNRTDTTQRVFSEVAAIQPRQLFVVADGPRTKAEWETCTEVRRIATTVDWPCELQTNFAEANMGCKARVSSGLDWVFSNCERAIVLEDDCLPHSSFFAFCAELLDRYQDDKRITSIGGNNFQDGSGAIADSYYFSRYPHIWGWASWRRAWRHYDVSMREWPALRRNRWLNDILDEPMAIEYWRRIFDATFFGDIDTWDYQWTFTQWVQSGLAIVPSYNLVANIGFGIDSTHTHDANAVPQKAVEEMPTPLRHPSKVSRDAAADRATFRHNFYSHRGARTMRAKAGLVAWRWLLQGLDAARFEARLRRAHEV
jgi:hypothetical protein